jgi:hypothetical protein
MDRSNRLSEASAGRSARETFPDVAAPFLGIVAHRRFGKGEDALLRAVGQLASVGEEFERRFLLGFLVQFVRVYLCRGLSRPDQPQDPAPRSGTDLGTRVKHCSIVPALDVGLAAVAADEKGIGRGTVDVRAIPRKPEVRPILDVACRKL